MAALEALRKKSQEEMSGLLRDLDASEALQLKTQIDLFTVRKELRTANKTVELKSCELEANIARSLLLTTKVTPCKPFENTHSAALSVDIRELKNDDTNGDVPTSVLKSRIAPASSTKMEEFPQLAVAIISTNPNFIIEIHSQGGHFVRAALRNFRPN